MVRLLQAGWETGDLNQIGTALSAGSNWGPPTIVTTVPAPRSGTYCLKCHNLAATAPGGSRLAISHASKTELFYAFGYFHHNASEVATAPSVVMFRAYDTVGNTNILITCEGDGNVRAYYATAGGANPATTQITLIGTSSITIAQDAWVLVEIHLIAATGATGTCEIKINGASALSVATVRTAQTNANYGQLYLEYGHYTTTGSTAGMYCAFDDLRVNDTTGSVNNTWCGDGSIRPMLVTGAGTTIAGGLTGAYTDVDEVPPNTSDYITGTTPGDGLTFQLANLVGVASCQAIEIITYSQNPDGGGGGIGINAKTAAGTSESSAIPVTANWAYHKRLLEIDPNDSAAWTQAKLDALEAGITVR